MLCKCFGALRSIDRMNLSLFFLFVFNTYVSFMSLITIQFTQRRRCYYFIFSCTISCSLCFRLLLYLFTPFSISFLFLLLDFRVNYLLILATKTQRFFLCSLILIVWKTHSFARLLSLDHRHSGTKTNKKTKTEN